jgi:5-bromo-4-chloroindolyl phosphate hydrolysis protein
MKTVLLISLLLANMGCADPATVYVCDSRNAVRYHLKANCRGLSNCTYRVMKVTVEEAKREGKTLCKWER